MTDKLALSRKRERPCTSPVHLYIWTLPSPRMLRELPYQRKTKGTSENRTSSKLYRAYVTNCWVTPIALCLRLKHNLSRLPVTRFEPPHPFSASHSSDHSLILRVYTLASVKVRRLRKEC